MNVRMESPTASREPIEVAAGHVDRVIGDLVDVLAARAGAHRLAASHPTARLTAAGMDLLAARVLTAAVRDGLVERVRACRASGASWHQVGQYLDLGALAEVLRRPVAQIAFEHLTGVVRPDPDDSPWHLTAAVFEWTCPECDAHIHDHGPDPTGHNARETGHHPNCPRVPGHARTPGM